MTVNRLIRIKAVLDRVPVSKSKTYDWMGCGKFPAAVQLGGGIETLRVLHWPSKVALVFGTRLAETILASGYVRRINRSDIWWQAI